MAKFRISGVPITEGRKLVGIITNRDLKFEEDFSRKIREVMTSKNLVTAKEGVTLQKQRRFWLRQEQRSFPIVDDDFNLKGLITIKDIEKQIKYPLSAKDEQGRLLCGAAVGITKNVMDRVTALVNAKVDCIVIDSAHGHSKNIITTLKEIKAAYPDLQVIVGNVATGEATKALIEAGADAVKIGIGPGSICTTRVVAGIGVPQVSAVMDCYEAAKPYGVPIIADGGIKYSGDMTKALAAGASVCMMGSMFAGCDEAPGEFELYQEESIRFTVEWVPLLLWRMVLGSLFPDRGKSLFRKVQKDVLHTRNSRRYHLPVSWWYSFRYGLLWCKEYQDTAGDWQVR